jgi:hypothetical protein
MSFYLRRSLGGYMVGTTAGFPSEVMEALALQSRRRIPQTCPQYHMSTCSAHRRVTGSGHLLDRGLGGYCWGNLPWVPWATGYIPKLWIRSDPSTGQTAGEPYTSYYRKWLHHSRLKRGATNLKRTNPKNDPCHHFSTLRSAWVDEISPPVCPLPPLSSTQGIDLGPRSNIPGGLPITDKHYPLWASGSGGLSHLV